MFRMDSVQQWERWWSCFWTFCIGRWWMIASTLDFPLFLTRRILALREVIFAYSDGHSFFSAFPLGFARLGRRCFGAGFSVIVTSRGHWLFLKCLASIFPSSEAAVVHRLLGFVWQADRAVCSVDRFPLAACGYPRRHRLCLHRRRWNKSYRCR